MSMKVIQCFFFGSLFLTYSSLFAEPRFEEWAAVREAMSEGQPKKAIALLDPILEAALAEKAYSVYLDEFPDSTHVYEVRYAFGELLGVNYVIADGVSNLDAPVSLSLQESVSSRRLYSLALELLDTQLSFQPRERALLRERARLYEQMERWERARADYETLLRIAPGPEQRKQLMTGFEEAFAGCSQDDHVPVLAMKACVLGNQPPIRHHVIVQEHCVVGGSHLLSLVAGPGNRICVPVTGQWWLALDYIVL